MKEHFPWFLNTVTNKAKNDRENKANFGKAKTRIDFFFISIYFGIIVLYFKKPELLSINNLVKVNMERRNINNNQQLHNNVTDSAPVID